MSNKKVDVAIVGAGLTGLTLAFYLEKAGKSVALIEKSDRVGGVINTIEEDGFVYEQGPNTGVIGSEGIVQLFDDLKGSCEHVTPNTESEERWILKGGKWVAIPNGLLKAIKTPLFSLKDKFRILGEPWRKKGTNPDESLADMVKRRMGQSYLDYAVDPFVSGIYAGDPIQLITRFAMPKLYRLEQDYGSFIKGAIKKKKEPKTALQKRVSREVFSAKGGLGKLIEGLENNISDEAFYCSSKNLSVQPQESGYNLQFSTFEEKKINIEADKVITTFGGEGLASVLPFIEKDWMKSLANTVYAKVVQVVVGYNKWNGRELKAFGGLVPSKENRDILGILFPSALFKSRCPEGGAVLSIFVGGMKKPKMIEKTEEEIKAIVMKEISDTLYCSDTPDLLRIHKYEKAIPQYDISTKDRLAAIDNIEQKYAGLYLAGNIKDGIGMADRVQQAWLLAKELTNN
ncbi:protoporphyrinogen oxidase [Labilibacter marinus]|uniref:protoporphyrinogen oxidase n=1 Tax=Labilibacter marinus TaxID=1477105 RepID=UPI00094F71E3|nr:protoporphyrinogen oxidase [Labilibacter marinus]